MAVLNETNLPIAFQNPPTIPFEAVFGRYDLGVQTPILTFGITV